MAKYQRKAPILMRKAKVKMGLALRGFGKIFRVKKHKFN